jgi:hypothetical protein
MFGDSTTSGPSVAASHRPLSKLSGCLQLTKHHPGLGGNPLRECVVRIGSGVKVAACLIYPAHRGVLLRPVRVPQPSWHVAQSLTPPAPPRSHRKITPTSVRESQKLQYPGGLRQRML